MEKKNRSFKNIELMADSNIESITITINLKKAEKSNPVTSNSVIAPAVIAYNDRKHKRGQNNVYSWNNMVNDDEKRKELCKSLEDNGPKNIQMIDLCRAVSDEVITGKWGYDKLPLTEKSGTDNVRKGIYDLAVGRSHSEISSNYVIKLGDKIVNKPSEEAMLRYNTEHNNRPPVTCPIFWYTDADGNKVNPFSNGESK